MRRKFCSAVSFLHRYSPSYTHGQWRKKKKRGVWCERERESESEASISAPLSYGYTNTTHTHIQTRRERHTMRRLREREERSKSLDTQTRTDTPHTPSYLSVCPRGVTVCYTCLHPQCQSIKHHMQVVMCSQQVIIHLC